MPKINTHDSEDASVESDEQYDLVARRRFDRRNTENTSDRERKNIHLKHLNRGQGERRSSRPALLSIDHMAKLRKK